MIEQMAASRAPASRAATEPLEFGGFETLDVKPPQGLLGRLFTTYRHLAGVLAGALVSDVRARRDAGTGKGARFVLARAAAAIVWPFLRRDLRVQPFPAQLRRRLEMLGPTYIKLGQILSLRDDLLPAAVTDELKHLLSRLPAVPFPVLLEIVVRDTGRAIDEMYSSFDPTPLGSASIGQTHRATTVDGDAVIVKVVKPGIRETLQRDARLLGGLGAILQAVVPRFQPKQLINEFTEYTLREVDLRREADNAETFAANFKDLPDVVFPKIYRQFSGRSTLCMEFFDGEPPDSPRAHALSSEDRRHLIDLGAASIIRMLYRDGFFHADLHPGNLLVLPGPKLGFIDLGMVGRLDGELRRTMMFYYFSLVTGDAESAARYLSAAARPGPGGDPAGFRREVTDISRRWQRSSSFKDYSLGQLILDSVSYGARFKMYFPVELVLMVKALVTFEAVGHLLMPGFDVAEISRRHVRSIFIQQFSPLRVFQEGWRGAPDLMEAVVKMPMLLTEGFRVLERTVRQPSPNPLAGLRPTLLAGFCVVAGAIVIAARGPWPFWTALFALGLMLAFRRGA